jgi:hypothetical protein
MNILQIKVKSQTTEMLKDVARGLFADYRDGADTALSTVLDELESRMDGKQFADFSKLLN